MANGKLKGIPDPRRLLLTILAIVTASAALPVSAGPYAGPGDTRLRHDLQLLGDGGAINIPLTTWPLSWGDIALALDGVDRRDLDPRELAAYERCRDQARVATRTGSVVRHLSVSAASNPRVIRSFEGMPREEGEASAGIRWVGNRFAANITATYVTRPQDGDDVRLDDSFVGVAVGNWMFSAGWQEHWWGPGRDGSLILSSNARPVPMVSLQRNRSNEFRSRWLSWIGPWTLHANMGLLDDDRAVDDALLFGIRAAFKPAGGLEIGLSRTAQWCGDARPCDMSTFVDLLLGNDNRGVNVDPEDEPGNQLAGVDIRWRLPGDWPLAVYAQWVGEDTRQGGPEIGSWMRLAGMEHWGMTRTVQHRTHIEIADTTCRSGALGFSEIEPNCAYQHSIYRTGYRYHGRSIGHGLDGDGLSYSLGSTLVQSAGHSWTLSLRYMEINRVGVADSRHTLSPTPQEMVELHLSHDRLTNYGRFKFGLGARRLDNAATGRSSTDVTGFVQWTNE